VRVVGERPAAFRKTGETLRLIAFLQTRRIYPLSALLYHRSRLDLDQKIRLGKGLHADKRAGRQIFSAEELG
jgi:hypothetical protein